MIIIAFKFNDKEKTHVNDALQNILKAVVALNKSRYNFSYKNLYWKQHNKAVVI